MLTLCSFLVKKSTQIVTPFNENDLCPLCAQPTLFPSTTINRRLPGIILNSKILKYCYQSIESSQKNDMKKIQTPILCNPPPPKKSLWNYKNYEKF